VKVIDGQGAFPRIQGDIPAGRSLHRDAAVRTRRGTEPPNSTITPYRWCRRSTVSGTEPTMLPAQWPVLLCNGAMGIAEGWATKVPAHNPREIMARLPGTSGQAEHNRRHIDEAHSRPRLGMRGHRGRHGRAAEYITTGRGQLTVRGTVSVDGKNVIVTELPPGVASNTVQGENSSAGRIRRNVGVADMSDLTTAATGCASWSRPNADRAPRRSAISCSPSLHWNRRSLPAWSRSTRTECRAGGRCAS